MTNLLALKERADTLDKLLDRDKERIVKSNQEFLALMLNYGEKIQNQKQFYFEENKKLAQVEREFQVMADQYRKLRVTIEKNLFYYHKEQKK